MDKRLENPRLNENEAKRRKRSQKEKRRRCQLDSPYSGTILMLQRKG
jgi:hypothetical protein